MTKTNKPQRVSDSLDTLVRCCGSCKHFDSEDISGGGWCVATDHATACGDDCPDWHDDFYTPNDQVDRRGIPRPVERLVGQVASISFPVGVKELAGMVDDLEKKHGKGLVMSQIGNALIISQPNATDEALRK